MKRFKPLDFVIYTLIGAVVAIIFGSIINWVNNEGIMVFETTSPLVFPFLIGAAMLIFLLLTIISDYRTAAITKDSGEDKDGLAHDVLLASMYAGGVLIYTVLVPMFGFIIGTIAFLAILMILMNYEELNFKRKAMRAVAVSVVTVPVLHFVFYEIFKVMLP